MGVPLQQSTIYTEEHRALVKLLAELRLKSGLRQAELAERLGRPQSYVSRYETGLRRLDLVELLAICTALDVDVLKVVRRWTRALDG